MNRAAIGAGTLVLAICLLFYQAVRPGYDPAQAGNVQERIVGFLQQHCRE